MFGRTILISFVERYSLQGQFWETVPLNDSCKFLTQSNFFMPFIFCINLIFLFYSVKFQYMFKYEPHSKSKSRSLGFKYWRIETQSYPCSAIYRLNASLTHYCLYYCHGKLWMVQIFCNVDMENAHRLEAHCLPEIRQLLCNFTETKKWCPPFLLQKTSSFGWYREINDAESCHLA